MTRSTRFPFGAEAQHGCPHSKNRSTDVIRRVEKEPQVRSFKQRSKTKSRNVDSGQPTNQSPHVLFWPGGTTSVSFKPSEGPTDSWRRSAAQLRSLQSARSPSECAMPVLRRAT